MNEALELSESAVERIADSVDVTQRQLPGMRRPADAAAMLGGNFTIAPVRVASQVPDAATGWMSGFVRLDDGSGWADAEPCYVTGETGAEKIAVGQYTARLWKIHDDGLAVLVVDAEDCTGCFQKLCVVKDANGNITGIQYTDSAGNAVSVPACPSKPGPDPDPNPKPGGDDVALACCGKYPKTLYVHILNSTCPSLVGVIVPVVFDDAAQKWSGCQVFYVSTTSPFHPPGYLQNTWAVVFTIDCCPGDPSKLRLTYSFYFSTCVFGGLINPCVSNAATCSAGLIYPNSCSTTLCFGCPKRPVHTILPGLVFTGCPDSGIALPQGPGCPDPVVSDVEIHE